MFRYCSENLDLGNSKCSQRCNNFSLRRSKLYSYWWPGRSSKSMVKKCSQTFNAI